MEYTRSMQYYVRGVLSLDLLLELLLEILDTEMCTLSEFDLIFKMYHKLLGFILKVLPKVLPFHSSFTSLMSDDFLMDQMDNVWVIH